MCDTNTTNRLVEILMIYKLFILKIWLVGYLLCCTNFFLRNAKEYTAQTECLYTPHQYHHHSPFDMLCVFLKNFFLIGMDDSINQQLQIFLLTSYMYKKFKSNNKWWLVCMLSCCRHYWEKPLRSLTHAENYMHVQVWTLFHVANQQSGCNQVQTPVEKMWFTKISQL